MGQPEKIVSANAMHDTVAAGMAEAFEAYCEAYGIVEGDEIDIAPLIQGAFGGIMEFALRTSVPRPVFEAMLEAFRDKDLGIVADEIERRMAEERGKIN